MSLDLGLVRLLVVLGRLDVTFDLGLLVLVLVRHCSSFGILDAVRRCQLSRRGSEHKSSHRPFKFATRPAILLRWAATPHRCAHLRGSSRTGTCATYRSPGQ